MLDVWAVDVEHEARRLALHWSRLDGTEHARAAGFRRDDDRLRFVIARSTRIEILAARLAVEPDALSFAEDAHGKPRVRTRDGRSSHFSSSHSGNWVLHAFADTEVGVDVERITPAMEALADFAWVLSAAERSFVLAHRASARAAALATVWVRKEAYVKALGEGLYRSLPAIGIECGNDAQPRLAFDRNASKQPLEEWRFIDVEIDAGHKACVVHAGSARPVSICRYREGATDMREEGNRRSRAHPAPAAPLRSLSKHVDCAEPMQVSRKVAVPTE